MGSVIYKPSTSAARNAKAQQKGEKVASTYEIQKKNQEERFDAPDGPSEPSIADESQLPEEEDSDHNNVASSKDVLSELNGVDWDAVKDVRRKNMRMGSLPVMKTASFERTRSPPDSFSRMASNAEDDAVGALRTRVMNNSFVSRSGPKKPACPRKMRRMSMPAQSMPGRMMREKMDMSTSTAATRGMQESFNLSGMLDQIVEEGNETEVAARIRHIQWVCSQLGVDESFAEAAREKLTKVSHQSKDDAEEEEEELSIEEMGLQLTGPSIYVGSRPE